MRGKSNGFPSRGIRPGNGRQTVQTPRVDGAWTPSAWTLGTSRGDAQLGDSEAALRRRIFPEQTATADIFAHLFQRPVSGLVHDGAFRGAAFGRGRRQPRPQRMA